MTAFECPALAEMVDYLAGDLEADQELPLEEHLFGCDACTSRMERLHRIGVGIREVVEQAQAGGTVNRGFVDRMLEAGLTVREYRLEPGQTVPCQAGPEDFVLVRLAATFGDMADASMEVVFHDLEADKLAPPFTQPVVVDRDIGEILLIYPGEEIRRKPRSIWQMRVHGTLAGQQAEIGPFVLDHTPQGAPPIG
jgi:anti-sigma factor RsiW